MDGITTLSDNNRVLERWLQHFETLLNQSGDIEPAAHAKLNQRQVVTELDDIPTREELPLAIAFMADAKVPGVNGIPSEILYGSTEEPHYPTVY